MAAFAKGVYDAVAYSAFRPTYPRRLFDSLWAYHATAGRGRRSEVGWQRAVDLGCGTGRHQIHYGRPLGQATVVIAERFVETIGVDPSSKMVSQATEQLKGQHIKRYTQTSGEGHSSRPHSDQNVPAETLVRYQESPAENLIFLENESVDFVSAAQSVHWFDHVKLWKELGRVLRPGGTAAFWGYSELRIKGFPSLTPIITYYSQGSDPIDPYRALGGEKVKAEPDSLAAFWEQPGRSILDFGLTAVPAPPAEVFDDTESKVIAFTGEHRDDIVKAYQDMGRNVEKEECILNKEMDWVLLDKYCRTWSTLSNFLDKYPEERQANDGKQDIVSRFLLRLREEMEHSTGPIPDKFLVEWPTTVLLFRKRV